MPTVLLDDDAIAAPHGAQTVGDMLGVIQSEARGRGRIITAVACDGRSVVGEDLTALLARPVEQTGRIELHSEPQRTLVLAILRQSAAVLTNAQDLRVRIAEKLSQGHTAEAMQSLHSFVGMCQQTHEAIAQCAAATAMDLTQMNVDDIALSAHIETITDSLRQLRDALTDQDYVRVADQMAFETGPTLDAWQDVLRAMIGDIERRPA